MKKDKKYSLTYFRTTKELGNHIVESADSHGMSKNAYLNKLLKEDMDRIELSILEQQAVEQYQLTIKENNTNEHKN
jgi:hypothetical protein